MLAHGLVVSLFWNFRPSQMRRILALYAALLLCGTAPAALAQAGAATPAPAPAAQEPELALRPGDLIDVRIYQEPELTGQFLVDEQGVAVLPLIGEQQVTGIGMRPLRERLQEAYRRHLRNPSITITPLRRVTVLGQVTKPGTYTLDPTVSLAGAIAMAGGASPAGDLRRVRIIRGTQVIRERVGVAESINAADVRSGDQIVVDERGWFERNSTFVVSALLSLAGIASSIIIATSR